TPEYARTKHRRPTNGSVAILNPNAANGSVSDGLRTISSPLRGSVPLTASWSRGEGNNSITKSSIVCTPLFLNDDPQTIGTIALSKTALRKASKISRSVNESGSSKNFSIKDSSYPATASNNFSRYSATSSNISSGIGTSVKVIPLSASFQTIPRLLIKSTTPLKSSSAPIGN